MNDCIFEGRLKEGTTEEEERTRLWKGLIPESSLSRDDLRSCPTYVVWREIITRVN